MDDLLNGAIWVILACIGVWLLFRALDWYDRKRTSQNESKRRNPSDT